MIRNRYSSDLAPEFQDMLRRNGLAAHIVQDRDGALQLMVKSPDSPVLYYPITEQQAVTMTDWGYLSLNKKALSTLSGIIGRDFNVPADYNHASMAGSRVIMGQQGVHLDSRDYKMMGRVDGTSPYRFFDPVVSGHLDGQRRPGELRPDGIGFSYKGAGASATAREVDVLGQFAAIPQSLDPRLEAAAGTVPAVRYHDAVVSDVYFSRDKWSEVLSSHGIDIDSERSTLSVRSADFRSPVVYDLSADDLSVLTAPSLSASDGGAGLEERLAVINGLISRDFARPVTMEDLDSTGALRLQPIGVLRDIMDREEQVRLEAERIAAGIREVRAGEGAVSGRELENLRKDRFWFTEVERGSRPAPADVTDISVSRTVEGQYRMQAVIDGKVVTHEISERQYDKFLALDDFHRMKMMSRIFPEVEMNGAGDGVLKALGAVLAGGAVAAEMAAVMSRPSPELYMERSGRDLQCFVKPGVDTPQDIVERLFEREMAERNASIGLGRGL